MPVGPAPRWRLDWLNLSGRGHTDDNQVQWILLEETGFWDSPDARVNVTERSNAHGSYVGPIYYAERVITVKGRAFCDDPGMLRRYWSLITGLCADPTDSYTLSCESQIGTLYCNVRRDGQVITTPSPFLNVEAFDFSVQLIAPDPRKYSTQQWTMRTNLPSATTGDGLSFTDPGLDFAPPEYLSFGAQNSSGLLQLTNNGTAPSTPTYELHGPLTHPTVTAWHENRAHVMTYNANLSAGEFLTIDPREPAVLLGGTASRRWLLNPAEFAAFSVPAADPRTNQPGRLNVGLTHEGGFDAGGYALAYISDAYF